MMGKTFSAKDVMFVLLLFFMLSGCDQVAKLVSSPPPKDLTTKQESKLNPFNWKNGVDKNDGGIKLTTVSESTGANDKATVTVKNSQGNTVATTTTKGALSGNQNVLIGNLPQGNYTVQVTGNSQGGTKTYENIPVKNNNITSGTFNTFKIKSTLN